MSRNESFKRITRLQRNACLREKGMTLLGGGLDEAPQAYKDINEIINVESDLVEIIARIRSRIMMMTDDPHDL